MIATSIQVLIILTCTFLSGHALASGSYFFFVLFLAIAAPQIALVVRNMIA